MFGAATICVYQPTANRTPHISHLPRLLPNCSRLIPTRSQHDKFLPSLAELLANEDKPGKENSASKQK